MVGGGPIGVGRRRTSELSSRCLARVVAERSRGRGLCELSRRLLEPGGEIAEEGSFV